MNKDVKNIDEILEKYGLTISVPMELLLNPKYNGMGKRERLRHNDVILYGVLSMLPKEKDEDGKEFVEIAGEDIATLVGTTTGSTPTQMVKRLEKFDLIERKKFIQGQPYRIYVKEIVR